MKKYQYLLFDWDGCLAKSLEIWLDAYKQVFAEYGVFPTNKEITRNFNKWDNPKEFGIEDWENCMEKVFVVVREKYQTIKLYEGAKDLLNKLVGKKKLALLSSSERQMLNNGLTYNKLEKIFDVVIGGDEVVKHKPHPEIFETGLNKLNGAKSRAVIIGDSTGDLEAAATAGIDSILIYPPSHELFYDLEVLKKHRPTHIVSNFAELEQLLI